VALEYGGFCAYTACDAESRTALALRPQKGMLLYG